MALKKWAFLSSVLLLVTTTAYSLNNNQKNRHTSTQGNSLTRAHTNPLRFLGKQPLSSPSMNGVWDFKRSVYAGVGTDGFIKKESHSYEWVVRLKQEGEKLTSDLIGARGSRGEHVCADADISGSVREAKVTFVVTYQGSCCSQEQMKFAGEISDDGKSLTGKIEPVDVPKAYSCGLAYANTTATKR